MRITPINCAEAIVEPFWDPQLSELAQWTIDPGAAPGLPGATHGLQVRQNWCWAEFEWARKPAAGPALRMRRRVDLPLGRGPDATSGYDRLMVSVMAPQGALFRMRAHTDRGDFTLTAPPAPALKKEYTLDLGDAARLIDVELEIEAVADGIAAGWFNWVGLQNSALLPRYESQWDRFDAAWLPYLQPAEVTPSFTPSLGLLVNAAELDALRERHAAFVREHGTSPFLAAAEQARQFVPEKMARDFVNFWGDTRYCRERDHGNTLLGDGPAGLAVNAAIAGLLMKDAELLRLGARFALALALSGRWDDGMICYFPGGAFEHRSFVQSLCVNEIALLLDLAGDLFTEVGRDIMMRRVAEEGLGAINFNTWKHEYIFHCNQLAWFTPGRMAGYAALEQAWPRVKPYTELALQDLLENLGEAILPDGGYVEGPTYFRCVGRDGGLSLYYYARARGIAFPSIIPEAMKRTAGFAAALVSTDDAAEQIPICDAMPRADQESVAFMAAALPESQWVRMFRKSVARTGGMPATVLACQLESAIPARAPDMPAFTHLPEMGLLASSRDFEGERVKLLVLGNRANAGHTHEDKGSFVLEFAGDTFAMDPGTCDYSSPLADILKNCERHNMLVPAGLSQRPHPACPLPADVKPAGQGDATEFHAQIDATQGWVHYRKWLRAWDSPAPGELTLRDEWDLGEGSGVEFYWQTRREVQVNGRVVRLIGRRGVVELEAPEGAIIRVDELPLLDGVQRRVVFGYAARAGVREVRVRLARYSAG